MRKDLISKIITATLKYDSLKTLIGGGGWEGGHFVNG